MSVTVADILGRAVEAHRAGNRAEAARAYEAVLRAEPANAEALRLNGLLAADTGDLRRAVDLLDRSIKARPNVADTHFNKANILVQAGDSPGALAAYGQALKINPDFSDARLNLGALLVSVEKRDEATAVFREMIEKSPHDARGYFNLGRLLIDQAKFADAVPLLQKALELRPDYFDAMIALSDAHGDLDQPDQALRYVRAAVQLQPASASARSRLAHALVRAGQIEEGRAAFAVAESIAPESAQSRQAFELGIGNALRKGGDHLGALAAYERGLLHEDASPQIYHNMAEAMAALDWIAAAAELEAKAVKLCPGDGRYLYNLGLFELKQGRLAEGWDKLEQRFYEQGSDIKTFKKRLPPPPPYWNGANLAGRKILLWREQGLGDEIMSAGMIPDLMELGATCRLMGSPRLQKVWQRSFPDIEAVPFGLDHAIAGSGCDFQLPIGSLGRFFRRDFSKFRRHTGYLVANPERVATLRSKYEAAAAGRRIVGISWRSKNERHGAEKSATLSAWSELLNSPGFLFVNLQYGDCRQDLIEVKQRLGIDIFNDETVDAMADMEDFVAQVAALDAVVSTSNTTVHVAGALNMPTFVLLPRGAGCMWYWFLEREDSPWYPSIKLIRAPSTAATNEPWWHNAISRARFELAKLEKSSP